MLPASSVSDVFATNMWTLSVFVSLTKRFQLVSSAHDVDKKASSGYRSSSAKSKSTSSASSHSSGMSGIDAKYQSFMFCTPLVQQEKTIAA